MKNRLLIISDLWGLEKSEWVKNYTNILKKHFHVHLYDCCGLGHVDKNNGTKDALHKQFINGGIDRAVQQLIELEREKINILAFSIGGTIAWKFGLATQNINTLICISATRLRLESTKPSGRIITFFGELDPFFPNSDWFHQTELQPRIVKNKGHECYTEGEFSKEISTQLVETYR